MVDRFTHDLTALARELARETLLVAAQRRGANVGDALGAQKRTRTTTTNRVAEGARLVSFLLACPGANASQLRAHLAMSNAQVRAVIAHLRTRRLIRSSGRTRASRYYATARVTTRRGTAAS